MNLDEDIENYEEPQSESKLSKKKFATIGFGIVMLLITSYFLSQVISEKIKSKKENNMKEATKEGQPTTNVRKNIEANTSYKGTKYNFGQKGENLDNKIEKIEPKKELIAPSMSEELKNYYERLLQEELAARKSVIAFDTGTTSNESANFLPSTSGANNLSIPNLNPEVDQNKIKEKKDFLIGKDEYKTDVYNSQYLINSISPYQVMAGSIIPGIFITGIKSTLPGKMIGQVREDVYDSVSGAYLLIPKGARILGSYDSNVTFGQNRVMVIWERILFPNGKSIQLDRFSGTDLSGYAGVTGKVNNHYGKLLTSVVLSSFIGAGTAIVTQDDNEDNNWRVAAGQGAGEQIINIGNKFAERVMNIAPEITVSQGSKFNIIVNSDLVLEPII
ncbi:MAG: TrbI/VirB10 family protein [Cetobacterium sp.]